MPSENDTYVLVCRECGSRSFEIHGPAVEGTVAFCAECHAEAGHLDELMMIVKERAERQQEEQRERRSH